jgi:hypothetical protein
MLKRLLGALREAERGADLVAEVLIPGPLGLAGAKEPRETAEQAAKEVNEARQRWHKNTKQPF